MDPLIGSEEGFSLAAPQQGGERGSDPFVRFLRNPANAAASKNTRPPLSKKGEWYHSLRGGWRDPIREKINAPVASVQLAQDSTCQKAVDGGLATPFMDTPRVIWEIVQYYIASLAMIRNSGVVFA
jgi:hypothetical protein